MVEVVPEMNRESVGPCIFWGGGSLTSRTLRFRGVLAALPHTTYRLPFTPWIDLDLTFLGVEAPTWPTWTSSGNDLWSLFGQGGNLGAIEMVKVIPGSPTGSQFWLFQKWLV